MSLSGAITFCNEKPSVVLPAVVIMGTYLALGVLGIVASYDGFTSLAQSLNIQEIHLVGMMCLVGGGIFLAATLAFNKEILERMTWIGFTILALPPILYILEGSLALNGLTSSPFNFNSSLFEVSTAASLGMGMAIMAWPVFLAITVFLLFLPCILVTTRCCTQVF